MNNRMVKTRDLRLDCLKGIAISLVIVGHILQFCVENYSSLFIFNIIWTLQIPLFMVVSGFFAGGGISFSQVFKKAKCYVIPFCSCFLIRELLILGRTDLISRVGNLVYHLENSLWYLFVLFEISLVHMVAVSISKKITGNNCSTIKEFVIYTILYGVFLVPFAALAVLMGTTFLGCKFVLYYSVFYWIGFAWRSISGIIKSSSEQEKRYAQICLDVAVLFAFIAYFGIISHVNIAEAGDGLIDIVIRFIASISGTYLIVRSVFAVCDRSNPVFRFLGYIGKYTLELYYIHYLFVPYMAKILYPLSSPVGMFSLVASYVAILVICAVGIILSNASPVLSFVLFGKSKK